MPQVEGETYFNNFEQTGYEELKEWSPEYYQKILESDANLRFAGAVRDQMAQSLEDWCLNMFIDTMSEEMIDRMEKFFYIDNSDKSLDERRKLLKTAQMGSGRMSSDRIKSLVMAYAGVDCSLDFVHELIISMDEGESAMDLVSLISTLARLIPAHLKWHIWHNMAQSSTSCHGSSIVRTIYAPPIRDSGIQ